MEYVEDLEDDESDMEDTAEWGGAYWGARAPAREEQRANGGQGDESQNDSDGEDDAEDGNGENLLCRERSCHSRSAGRRNVVPTYIEA